MPRRAAGAGGLFPLMESGGPGGGARGAAACAAVPTLVLCGPGNNGGDGYVAARLLAQAGWPVSVAALAAPARAAMRPERPACGGAGGQAFEPAAATRAGLVIDAVLGAGLSRDVPDAVADVLAAARRVVAIDVPSGVDGETGAIARPGGGGGAHRHVPPPQAGAPAAAGTGPCWAAWWSPISGIPATRRWSGSWPGRGTTGPGLWRLRRAGLVGQS